LESTPYSHHIILRNVTFNKQYCTCVAL
jgi:hypothetical protein